MVLTELAQKLQGAIERMKNKHVINKEVIDELLKEITNTLLDADIAFQLVKRMRINLQKKLDVDTMSGAVNRRVIVQRVVHDELCTLLDPNPGVPSFKPDRKRQNVVMFVGLQGAGKTTTVTKYANYYKRKSFRTALVCADTFRAGAMAQLEQNAARCQIPFYGDEDEKNPVKIAKDGVQTFLDAGMQLIIVDTSGRHKQEEGLFREMEEIRTEINPDVIILVMDGAMGQSASDHALAFKNSVNVGGIIITKLDDRNAKGGAALSAVVMTQSPVLFIGTGEHMDDLDEFDPRGFANQLLGVPDFHRVLEIVKDNVKDVGTTKEDLFKLQKGELSLRDFQKQMESVKDMPFNKVISMIGLGNTPLGEENGKEKFKSMMVIMDSMTNAELDNPKLLTDHKSKKTRIDRIARGSGRSNAEVNLLLSVYKQLQKSLSIASGITRKGGSMNQQMSKIQRAMAQMGGMPGMGNMGNIDLKGMMKNFTGM